MSLPPPDPPDGRDGAAGRDDRGRSDAARRLAAMLAELDAAIEREGSAGSTSAGGARMGRTRRRSPPRHAAAPAPRNAARSARPAAPAPAPLPPPAATPAAPATGPVTATTATPMSRPRGRRRFMAFGVVLVTLVLAIPALGYTGVQRLLRSRDGRITVQTDDPAEPGYEALVEPTPTALVVQVDADGAPQSLTVLALGAGDTGGSVIFVPIDTRLDEPAFSIDRLRLAHQDGEYRVGMDVVVGQLLGIGFTEVVEVANPRWAELVSPVAPLAVQNPDTVFTDDARFPSGPLALAADEVGPYLLARAGEEESDLNRMNRQDLLWRSWLESVAASDDPDPVPGESDAGIGRFVRTLARGTVDYQVLPVVPVPDSGSDEVDGQPVFVADAQAVGEVITAAVPFPVGGGEGQRYRVKVLNGVRGEVVSTAVTDRLVAAGAQIDVLGNARRLGQAATTVEYYDASHARDAEAVRDALGGGEVELRQGLTDSVDVTVTVGSDVLDVVDPGSGSDPDGSRDSTGSSGSSPPGENGEGGTSPTEDDDQGGGGG